MADHDTKHGSSTPKHEVHDANFKVLVICGFVVALMVVAGFLVSWGVLGYFTNNQSLGEPATPIAHGREVPPPGVPQLQAEPREDLDKYLQQQKHVLSSYGWVDREGGIVRIPINRAMGLLLKQGLPVRNSKTPKGLVQPGEVQQYNIPEGYMPQH